MDAIAKIHPIPGLPAPALLVDHVVMQQWWSPSGGLLYQLRRHMDAAAANPARCVVLLPYAQLRPMAQRLWQQVFPDGFSPRFETTRSWAAALGVRADDALDLRLDRALDLLTAQSLLLQSGQGAQADTLAAHLVDAANQLAPQAAARPPLERESWAAQCRDALRAQPGAVAGQWESLVAQLALEWVRLSNYASDIFYTETIWQQVDLVLQVPGLNPDPLADGLGAFWGGQRWVSVPWQHPSAGAVEGAPTVPNTHECLDAEDEARRSAACAVRHIVEGRFPLALVSSDRAFTRQVQVQLEACGVSVRDETGWKLSTTRAGTFVLALLRAATWNASADTVLNWLKLAPFAAEHADALELVLRRYGVRDWNQVARLAAVQKLPRMQEFVESVQAARTVFPARAPLTDWLGCLREALNSSGYLARLESGEPELPDTVVPEGSALMACLQLDAGAQLRLQAAADGMAWAQRHWTLSEFTAWVSQSLEAASWSPDYPLNEQVVLVPLSQLLARPFAAVVLCGCDEVRLPASVPPPGIWTRAQREILGLPSREVLEKVQCQAWAAAFHTPHVDVLWRTSDDSGEALMASTLVQVLQTAGSCNSGLQSAWVRTVNVQPVQPPKPQAGALTVQRLSASTYDDLRTCPYRFFALRLLGLQSSDELEQEVDKRDFGLWLHEVLSRFHQQLGAAQEGTPASRAQLLDDAADQVSRAQGLAHAEFLPYMASWPAIRDHYLKWLDAHEAKGYRFAQSEVSRERGWQGVVLHGRLDRIDTLGAGQSLVLDYKTESSSRTRERVADALEDTQMAFYGALLQEEGQALPQGSYLTLGESECKEFPQPDMPGAVKSLLAGIAHDVQQIAQGVALPALGEGDACTYCDARGLCRKDFWGAV